MAIVIPTSSETLLLKQMLNQTLTISLFKENIAPGKTTTLANIGQLVVSNTMSDLTKWTFTSQNGITSARYLKQTFEISSLGPGDDPIIIYGYCITDQTGQLLWLEKLPSQVIFRGPTDKIHITPRIEIKNIIKY